MTKFFNKYLFPVLTGINTIQAIAYIVALTTPAATPMTAFLAVVFSIVAFGGITTIMFEYQTNKAKTKLNVVDYKTGAPIDNKKA